MAVPDGLRDALAERYVLERELGRGGMAVVYLAHDLRHDRPVALKTLLPELAATLGPDRFQREIHFAARLQHPHILTVLDSGQATHASEQRAWLWFTMPFVEGESLRDRLRREHQLPVHDALRIADEAARALDYAHTHGVVHRDIKPENILLTKDGSTLVADFGIARALAGSDDKLTETGMAVGTVAYMSPEQASGESVDARTDVYALGAVLYEMLAGEPPFTGPTAQAIIVKRLTQPVPSLRAARPNVPVGVDQAVHRALAPIAADRFATAAEFGQALQAAAATSPGGPAYATTVATPASPAPSATTSRLVTRPRVPVAAVTLALGFLIGLGVLFAWRHAHAGADETSGQKRVAVLPFENLGDSADAYFADGITNELRGKLSQLPGLAVIARASSNEYRHTTKPPQQIARELGADYLLTATVQWEKVPGAPSRVRVSPELVRVQPGAAPTTKWQQGFDAALTDVFQVQADIASQVANALKVALGDSVRHELAAQPTANLAAYDAFLKGEAAWQQGWAIDVPSIRRATGFYEQAVALDSSFGLAWAQLARSRAYLYYQGTPVPQLGHAAKAAAERAQRLDPNRPETYLALWAYFDNVTLDHGQARSAVETGLKLAPDNVDLLASLAISEQYLGRWEAAVPPLQRATTLDPRSARTARVLGSTLQYLRRYGPADSAADRALALAPTSVSIRELKAEVALGRGDLAGAQAVIRAGLAVVDSSAVVAFFGQADDLYWVLEDAQQRQLLALAPSAFDGDRGTWGLERAETYYLRGDHARARVYADSARLAFEAQLRATPDDGQRHALYGLALAYMGRAADAVREGERGAALVPISRDANLGTYIQHQLVRIYLLAGQPERALDHLEPLLQIPYMLSPGWLRIDPTFDPLRKNPRFMKLVKG
ncbi:MAG: protein kinase domain-containing protein [Gemmatimonadales bacterium]